MGINDLYSKDAVGLSSKMSKEPEYKKISIKEEFAQTIEDFIRAHPELGYRSIAQFLEDSSRRRLEQLKAEIKPLPRMEQVNTDENGVKIFDRQLHEVIQVYFKPNGVRCGYHQSNSCEHVEFAFKQPDVRRIIDKKIKEGWKIEVPEES